jgi:hypothetical protein
MNPKGDLVPFMQSQIVHKSSSLNHTEIVNPQTQVPKASPIQSRNRFKKL